MKCTKCGKDGFVEHDDSHHVEYDGITAWCETKNCIFNHVCEE